jgi:hypothetical protein
MTTYVVLHVSVVGDTEATSVVYRGGNRNRAESALWEYPFGGGYGYVEVWETCEEWDGNHFRKTSEFGLDETRQGRLFEEDAEAHEAWLTEKKLVNQER